MAANSNPSAQKHAVTDPSSPYYISTYLPGISLTTIKLKGENYSTWEQSAIMTLKSQNKLGFITGDIKKPEPTSSDYTAWEQVNSLLCSWMSNSLEPPVLATVSRISEVKIMWDSLKARYSVENGLRLYKLWSDLSVSKQSGSSIMTYYTSMLAKWDDLSILSPLSSCSCDKNSGVTKWFENLKIYQFLMGLDDVYASLRTQIINTDPLPSLDRVYAMVSQEESHKVVTHSRDVNQALGFAAHTRDQSNNSTSTLTPATLGPTDRFASNRPFCTFCNSHGHTYDQCFSQLRINPSRGRGRGRGRGRSSPPLRPSEPPPAFAHAASTGSSSHQPTNPSHHPLPSLTPEQMNRLLAMLDTPPPASESLVGSFHGESDWAG